MHHHQHILHLTILHLHRLLSRDTMDITRVITRAITRAIIMATMANIMDIMDIMEHNIIKEIIPGKLRASMEASMEEEEVTPLSYMETEEIPVPALGQGCILLFNIWWKF